MLIGIDPLLSPDLLRTLRAMGHGEEIAIVDANFPGEGFGRRCLRADGLAATDMLRAVLSVMPVDTFVDDPIAVMERVEGGTAPIVEEFTAIVRETADHPAPLTPMERFAFYDRAKAAHAVLQTGERRLYGNIIVKKGVVAP
ncbi:MAG: RbsD/FucU family protein [Shimia sp.]